MWSAEAVLEWPGEGPHCEGSEAASGEAKMARFLDQKMSESVSEITPAETWTAGWDSAGPLVARLLGAGPRARKMSPDSGPFSAPQNWFIFRPRSLAHVCGARKCTHFWVQKMSQKLGAFSVLLGWIFWTREGRTF